MPRQAAIVLDLDPPEHQPAPFGERVAVVADAGGRSLHRSGLCVRDDLADLDAVESDEIARGLGSLRGCARSLLGLERHDRSALSSLQTDPVTGHEPRGLRHLGYDLILELGCGRFRVVNRYVDD